MDPAANPGLNGVELSAGLATTPGYRYAEVVGAQLFVAGQVPLDADGDLLALGDPASQAEACLENLRLLVGVHGFAIDDVRHLTVHVVGEHQNLLAAWAAVVGWFGGDGVPPATLLGAHLLGYAGQLVEIDATIVART